MEDTRHLSAAFDRVSPRPLAEYEAAGGYAALRRAAAMAPAEIQKIVLDSGLRGLGGAGFPTGRKWGFVPKDTGLPVYLVVNGDEGEPGTFKDREIMRRDPHRLVEGVAIASLACGVERAYIYVRGEFLAEARAVEAAVAEARGAGLLGPDAAGAGRPLEVRVHRGAGAYICGEETGLLSSLEGKPGKPKLKPPFPAVKGLFGCPTVVNNVETLARVPLILERGPAWNRSFGTAGCPGVRLFCLSGHVARPGLYELPFGVTVRDLVFAHAGGIRGGRKVKGVIPGGASAPVLTADELDVPHDFDALAKAGTMAGSAGVIVFDEETSAVDVALAIARFFAHESCGQCSQCREGTGWLAHVLERFARGEGTRGEIDLLLDVSSNMQGQTICVLADAAGMACSALARKFRADFEARAPRARFEVPGTIEERAWNIAKRSIA